MSKPRKVHKQVVREGHAFMACEPQIRMSNYLPLKLTTEWAKVTCPSCLATRENQ